MLLSPGLNVQLNDEIVVPTLTKSGAERFNFGFGQDSKNASSPTPATDSLLQPSRSLKLRLFSVQFSQV